MSQSISPVSNAVAQNTKIVVGQMEAGHKAIIEAFLKNPGNDQYTALQRNPEAFKDFLTFAKTAWIIAKRSQTSLSNPLIGYFFKPDNSLDLAKITSETFQGQCTSAFATFAEWALRNLNDTTEHVPPHASVMDQTSAPVAKPVISAQDAAKKVIAIGISGFNAATAAQSNSILVSNSRIKLTAEEQPKPAEVAPQATPDSSATTQVEKQSTDTQVAKTSNTDKEEQVFGQRPLVVKYVKYMKEAFTNDGAILLGVYQGVASFLGNVPVLSQLFASIVTLAVATVGTLKLVLHDLPVGLLGAFTLLSLCSSENRKALKEFYAQEETNAVARKALLERDAKRAALVPQLDKRISEVIAQVRYADFSSKTVSDEVTKAYKEIANRQIEIAALCDNPVAALQNLADDFLAAIGKYVPVKDRKDSETLIASPKGAFVTVQTAVNDDFEMLENHTLDLSTRRNAVQHKALSDEQETTRVKTSRGLYVNVLIDAVANDWLSAAPKLDRSAERSTRAFINKWNKFQRLLTSKLQTKAHTAIAEANEKIRTAEGQLASAEHIHTEYGAVRLEMSMSTDGAQYERIRLLGLGDEPRALNEKSGNIDEYSKETENTLAVGRKHVAILAALRDATVTVQSSVLENAKETLEYLEGSMRQQRLQESLANPETLRQTSNAEQILRVQASNAKLVLPAPKRKAPRVVLGFTGDDARHYIQGISKEDIASLNAVMSLGPYLTRRNQLKAIFSTNEPQGPAAPVQKERSEREKAFVQNMRIIPDFLNDSTWMRPLTPEEGPQDKIMEFQARRAQFWTGKIQAGAVADQSKINDRNRNDGLLAETENTEAQRQHRLENAGIVFSVEPLEEETDLEGSIDELYYAVLRDNKESILRILTKVYESQDLLHDFESDWMETFGANDSWLKSAEVGAAITAEERLEHGIKMFDSAMTDNIFTSDNLFDHLLKLTPEAMGRLRTVAYQNAGIKCRELLHQQTKDAYEADLQQRTMFKASRPYPMVLPMDGIEYGRRRAVSLSQLDLPAVPEALIGRAQLIN